MWQPARAYAAMPGGGADGRPFADAIGAAGLTCGTGVGSGEGEADGDGEAGGVALT